MQREQQIDHVISVSVTEIAEKSFGPGRFLRTFKIKTLLGDELVLRLTSESRLALLVEPDPRPAPWPEGLPIPPAADSKGDSAS